MHTSRINLILFLIILTTLFSSGSLITLLGQDDDSGDRRYGGQSVDVVFPVRLHFNLTLLVPASDVTSASVAVNGQTATVDLSELEGDDQVNLTTYWDAPASSVPAFNSQIDYVWTVDLEDDSSLQFEDSVAYAPDNAIWTQNNDPKRRISLIAPNSTSDYLREQLSEVYQFLLSQGQSEPHFRLALSPDSSSINPCVPDSSGEPSITDPVTGDTLACEGRAEASVSQLNFEIVAFSGDPIKAIVPRMVTEFFGSYWESGVVPPWFEKGLGQFFVPDGNSRDVEEVRDLTRSDELFTLEQMNSIPDDPATTRTWMAQAHMMVRYMVSQAGIQGVFLLGRTSGQDEESFAESYQRTIEQPLETLIPSLEIWIFRQQAEQSMTIDIYTGPTDIPPATPTSSPFPPTRGPTFTPTITLTPRPTFPPTSTPPPTNTPSPTPRN